MQTPFCLFEPFGIAAKVALVIVAFSLANCLKAGEIAFTFDDAPTKDSSVMTGIDRTEKLIDALKQANIPGTLFFVKTSAISDQSSLRLKRYVDEGFHLANHSHSHKSANELSSEDYVADVYQAKLALAAYENVLPYHRFPFLHYGVDRESIESTQNLLAALGYENGYVTVDNFDWYLNSLLVKAKKEGKAIDYEKLGELYVEVLWGAIEFYDDIAVNALGVSVKHVLLLHENDLAALYLPELARHIREQGWAIISPQEAYQDPIAEMFPVGVFHNQGRVSALALEKGMDVYKLRNPSESEDYLDALVHERGIFE